VIQKNPKRKGFLSIKFMIYFTSDTHFYHAAAIKHYSRPFLDVEEMNNKLIGNWNKEVKPDDEVYILGDFMNGSGKQANQILEKLNGVKYLIKGNHDEYLDDEDFNKAHFQWIKEYHILKYKGRNFVLFHYPIFEWQGFFKKDFHIYGHVHNQFKYRNQKERFSILNKYAVNVCVDVSNYKPVSVDSIIEKVEKKKSPVELLKKTDSQLFWHITPFDNIASILEFGLLPRNTLKKGKMEFSDIAPEFLTRNRTRLGLTNYVPFHFFPHNPMDITLIFKHRNMENPYVFITIEEEVASKLNSKFVLTFPDHKGEIFYSTYEACKNKIDFIRQHTDYSKRKDKFEALGECLVPDYVLPENIYSIIVGSDEDKQYVEKLAEEKNPKWSFIVEARPGYFANYIKRSPFYTHSKLYEG